MTLTSSHLISLLPLLLTAATPVVLMLVIAFKRHHGLSVVVAFTGLFLALLSLLWVADQNPRSVTSLLIVDNLSWFYSALLLLCALVSISLTSAYIKGFSSNKEEIYLLLTIASTGALVMVSSQHMATLFLGLEILSVPLYGMVAYTFRSSHSLEGAFKYLLLSATASAFLLFGMALLYAELGTLSFSGISGALSVEAFGNSPILMAGTAMILIGLGFKLSFVPFHLWTPDVYQGAPAPVGGFLATVSKVAVFALLMRFLAETPVGQQETIMTIFAVIAALTIFVGNLLALQQANLKRLLAYSSVAHFGYLLVAVVANNSLSSEAINLYLVIYALSTLGTFGVVTLVSSPFSGQDTDHISDFQGLFWKRPYLAIVFTIMILSLAGIPLTAGFIGKFFIMSAGVAAHLWWLLAALVIGSAISIYYYLRVIVTLYMNTPTKQSLPHQGFGFNGVVLILLTATVLFIGIYPQAMLDLLQAAGLGIQ